MRGWSHAAPAELAKVLLRIAGALVGRNRFIARSVMPRPGPLGSGATDFAGRRNKAIAPHDCQQGRKADDSRRPPELVSLLITTKKTSTPPRGQKKARHAFRPGH